MFAFLWPDVFANYCSSNLLVLLIALFWVFYYLAKRNYKRSSFKNKTKVNTKVHLTTADFSVEAEVYFDIYNQPGYHWPV